MVVKSRSRFSSHARGLLFVRLAIWIAAGILTLQLIESVFHHHDLAEDRMECISCYWVTHVPSGLPPLAMETAPAASMFQYLVPTSIEYFFLATTPGFLIPLSQAPPAHSLPL